MTGAAMFLLGCVAGVASVMALLFYEDLHDFHECEAER